MLVEEVQDVGVKGLCIGQFCFWWCKAFQIGAKQAGRGGGDVVEWFKDGGVAGEWATVGECFAFGCLVDADVWVCGFARVEAGEHLCVEAA